jgi:hypothetical protein
MTVKLLSGNDLLTGTVLWWSDDGWQTDIRRATSLDSGRAEAVLDTERQGERINDLALVDVEPLGDGGFRPVRMRERIRAAGPSIAYAGNTTGN